MAVEKPRAPEEPEPGEPPQPPQPAKNGFAMTLNEPIGLIDLWLRPVYSYAANQLADEFEPIEEVFNLLNSIVDIKIESIDSDQDGDLDPLFNYMPEKDLD